MYKIKGKEYKIITVKADIHIDGDVYIEDKDSNMIRVGCLGESTFGQAPDPFYLKVLDICKK